MTLIESETQAPTTACMPDLVRQLLARVERKGYAGLTIGPVTRQACQDYLRQLDAVLVPAPKERVLARIATLLAHYWTPKMPENLQQAVALDWWEILRDVPWVAVEQAALEWLRTKDRKPTPGQFRKMAEQFIDGEYGDQKVIRYVLKQDYMHAGSSARN